MQVLRDQQVEVLVESGRALSLPAEAPPPSRAERAHWRLSWAERLTRNARAPTAGRVTIRLFGVPEGLAAFLGLPTTSD